MPQTQTITISIVDGWIEVRSPYAAKAILASIPTARWSKFKKCWRYPAAPDTAARLFALCYPVIGNVNNEPDFYLNFLDVENHNAFSRLFAESEMRDLIERCGAPNVEARGLKTKLWTHQQTAFNMAMALKLCMLAMDMSTGKTLVGLAVMTNTDSQYTLVFCPRYVVPVWAEQAVEHLENPPAQILELGSEFGPINKRLDRLKLARQWCADRDERLLAIFNYEAVASSRGKGGNSSARKLQDYLLSEKWDYIILDESQKIKAPGGATSKFMAQLRDRAQRRNCMSGTPFHNTAMDTYAPYRFLSPDLFGTSYAKMKAEHAEEDRWGGIAGIKNEDELHRKFYRIAYRVKTDDVLDLPEESEVIRKCDLEPEARIVYGELEQHMITTVKEIGIVAAANGAVKVMRLIQLTGGWLTNEDGNVSHRISFAKSNLLGELLDDLPLREPIVVICFFHNDMDAIRQICEKKGRTVAEMSGRTNNKKGQEKIEEWKNGERDVLIVQIRSGSSGINWMVRAHIGIVYSLGHISPGDWDQIRRRLVREGQTKPVQFIHLQARSTRDNSNLNALRKGIDVVRYILDEMKGGKEDVEQSGF